MDKKWDRSRSIAIAYKEYRVREGARKAVEFVKGGNWDWSDYGIEFCNATKIEIVPWENILSVSQLFDQEYA